MGAALAVGGCSGDPQTSGLGPVLPGTLVVAIDGLPAGAPAAVTLTGPGGFARSIAQAETIGGLAPGSYTLAAQGVRADGDGYAALPLTQSVSVKPGPTVTTALVTYAVTTGRMELSVSGLPAGVPAAVGITGPGGYGATMTAGGVLAGLEPGVYTLRPSAVVGDGDRYAGQPDSLLVLVTPGTAPSPAAVSYVLSSGRLNVVVSGVPAGGVPGVTVTGPGGYSTTLSESRLLRGLTPGQYAIVASSLSAGGHGYAASTQPAAVTVAASLTPATVEVGYAIATGGLAVAVSGLPDGVPAAVSVTGPGPTSFGLTASATLIGLAPGTYVLAAANVSNGGAVYLPVPVSVVVNLVPGETPIPVAVGYTRGTGVLQVNVGGLPAGAPAAVTVSGPVGYSANLTASATLPGLTPGSYTVAAGNVMAGGFAWAPSPSTQISPVGVGTTTTATVTYTAANGALTITITGLPGGVPGSVTVSGPGGYSAALTASGTLSGLAPGAYSVTAANVVSSGQTYQPSPSSQSRTVTAGSTASASVAYSVGAPPPPPPPPPPPATLNLVIDGMYLTQAAQRYDGTRPLVAGRNAYLRVFVKANEPNSATPAVRVRFYSGASLLQTSTITAPGASTPTAVTEGTLASSWNLAVPGALVQPNLRILADVDPANAVAESDESDNAFPASGTPFSVDVRILPTFNLRFVPVLQQANGLQGNITAGNQAQYLDQVLKMLPIAGYDADIRSVYTTTAPVLESGNGNGAWGTVLSEVLALRSADGSTRYYYGVVKTTYSSGVAGIGYVGGSARTALGWDRLPSGSGVMAHELGHNMSRSHAPCGGVSGADPNYPYPGGQIGIWGLDLATLALKAPTTTFDLMGYCNPDWVSDYNWAAMIQYRQSNPNYAPPSAGSSEGGLLVWGRVSAAGVVLEPAFRVPAGPTGLVQGSSYRVEGLDPGGRVLFSHGLRAETATDDQTTEVHLAAVLPVSLAAEQRLAGLRLVTPAGSATRLSAQAMGGGGPRPLFRDPTARASRPGPTRADLRWDGATYPMALVRDAATGEILSFARGGQAVIWTATPTLDLVFSDGVRGLAVRVRP